MKKTMMLLAALVVAAAAHADGYAYLAIASADGTAQTLTAVGLEITFANGKLVATNATTSEQATLTLADLASMYFTNTRETAVRSLWATDAWGLEQAEHVYDLAGREVQRGDLRPGVYVIRKGSETKKVQLR